jgi:hypothetical protein
MQDMTPAAELDGAICPTDMGKDPVQTIAPLIVAPIAMANPDKRGKPRLDRASQLLLGGLARHESTRGFCLLAIDNAEKTRSGGL